MRVPPADMLIKEGKYNQMVVSNLKIILDKSNKKLYFYGQKEIIYQRRKVSDY